MSRGAQGLLVAVLMSGALLLTDLLVLPRPSVAPDSGAAADHPRRKIARVQADMERVARGDSPWPLGPGATRDPLERLPQALDAFLRGREMAFRDHVALIRAEAPPRLSRLDPAHAEALAPVKGASPLLELILAMRLVDATLVIEAGEGLDALRYDLKARRAIRPRDAGEMILDGVWLRLPCPVIKGRRAEFEAASARLGDLAGPLLSCPALEAQTRDFALMERLAARPAGFAALAAPPPPAAPTPYSDRPPPPPWDAAAAIRFMDINPDGAEPPLRLATLGGASAKLDLALFLHAFRDPSAARDEEIRGLMAGVDRLSLAAAKGQALRFSGPLAAYDGTDASLIPSLRLASATGSADIVSGLYRYAYVIPCAVLNRRPALAMAESYAPEAGEVEVEDGLPMALSGCLAGRGRTPGFPEADLADYLVVTADADGGGYSNHPKTPRYPVMATDLPKMDVILHAPRAALEWPAPSVAMPYQVWAYGSATARLTAARIGEKYLRARASLSDWFRTKGLDEGEAAQAAERALFRLSYGAECGGAPAPASLRRALLDGAPVTALVEAMTQPPSAESLQPFTLCSATAHFDPLAHLAAAHPALPLLWQAAERALSEADPEGLRGLRDVELPNAFGKTPLMAAAQADLAENVQFLLERGARVNAVTWQSGKAATLAHDSRSALHYAAAQGSVETIRTLLAGGADRFQSDSKGMRAAHYLLGLGPVPANPNLSAAERAEMVAALY